MVDFGGELVEWSVDMIECCEERVEWGWEDG